MIYIKHRMNKIRELKEVQKYWGVEIDLRSNVNNPHKLHLSHEPWDKGDDFESWLYEFKRLNISGPIILNTKEDGLENKILEILKIHSINNFFFLDTALPTLVKWTNKLDEKRFAVRYSSYEPIEFVSRFKGVAEWVWVDCFDGKAMDVTKLLQLKPHFRICLVSPELQGQPLNAIALFKDLFKISDAVCTKDPVNWEIF